MALSTYYNYNCYPLQTPNNNNSEFITFHEEEEPLLHDGDDELIAPQNYHHFSSYFDPTSTTTLVYPHIHPNSQLFHCSFNEIFPTDDQDFNYNNNNYLPCPKRQKCCFQEEQLLHSSLLQEVVVSSNNYFLDDFVSNPNPNPSPSLFQAEPPYCAVQDFVNTQLPNEGIVVDVQCDDKRGSERTISTQSIAARERRRKITEKTQELGKLVPGGPKMNTAEMLHAAAKYVKYLQAQVGMLQLMEETLNKEDKAAPPPTEDLHKLVVSPFVQEKLYSEERCFVPKEFVTTLTNDDDVLSKPTILKGLKQLIGTDIEKKPKQE